jgi:hypothetical protein
MNSDTNFIVFQATPALTFNSSKACKEDIFQRTS